MDLQQHRARNKGGLLRGAVMGAACLLLTGCMANGGLESLGLFTADAPPTANAENASHTAQATSSAANKKRTLPGGVAAASAAASATEPPDANASKASSAVHARSARKRETSSYLASLRRKIDAAFTPDKPPRAERQQLGDALASRVLQKVEQLQDAALQARLGGIVRKLAVPARQESDFPATWRLHVLDMNRADAFTSGGGHLFITRSMVELLQTDERIATVLAHEMAHNLLAHVWGAQEKKKLARKAHAFSREVLAEKMKMPWLGKSVSFLVQTSLNTYSRQQEYDADALGLHLLVRAGYHPQAALQTFDVLRKHFREQGSLENFFYSHHPLYQRRRWYLANRIRAYYRKEAGLPPVQRANWRTRHSRDIEDGSNK